MLNSQSLSITLKATGGPQKGQHNLCHHTSNLCSSVSRSRQTCIDIADSCTGLGLSRKWQLTGSLRSCLRQSLRASSRAQQSCTSSSLNSSKSMSTCESSTHPNHSSAMAILQGDSHSAYQMQLLIGEAALRFAPFGNALRSVLFD